MTPATIIRSFQVSSDSWGPEYKFLLRLYIARAVGVVACALSCPADGESVLRALYAAVIAWKRACASAEGIDWSTLSGWYIRTRSKSAGAIAALNR
jgi:predicted RNA polymerase sigma factor